MRSGRKNLLLLSIQLMLLLGNLYSQNDSLFLEFNKTPKTAGNVSKLIDLSSKLIDYNVDSALSCAYQIQQISIPSTDNELQCRVLINLGSIAKTSGKYDEANKYLFQALEVAEKNNLISCEITGLYQIGDLNRCMSFLDKSLLYLYLSRNLAYNNKVSHQYAEIYDRISSTYFQLADQNYPQYEYLQIPNQNDIGTGKKTPDDYIRLCKIYADSALLFSKRNNDTKINLSSLNILGAYYRFKKQYKEAIEYFDNAIGLAQQNNYNTDIPNYFINLAKTYSDKKQFENAIENALKAYQMADRLNILTYKSTSANVLRTSYEEIKDYKNALKYNHIEASTRAEMLSQQNLNKISELDKKYQTEQKQKEIEHQKVLLDLKNVEVFWKNIIITVMFIAIIAIVAGIFFIQKQKTALDGQKREIQSQADKITEQYQRLEKLDLFKETLTHALVHDLKNPLSQIMLNTRDQAVNAPARKMLRLITNMLDVEKYETTGFILTKETLSLRNILAEVINGQEISLKEKNLELQLHFTDFKIVADKEVMTRVFDNLLSNAIRHSPLNQRIDVLAESSGDNMLHISMNNYGEPIPEEALPYIFDKYRHFGKTNSSSHHSTGLGLTFCKMAVEAHGGQIGARNNPGGGCRFWFTVKNASQTVETKETEIVVATEKNKLNLSNADCRALKEVVKQMKDVKIFEITRFHEILDPLKETSESTVNEWISLLFGAVYIQNLEEYNRLINLAENEQAKNIDC